MVSLGNRRERQMHHFMRHHPIRGEIGSGVPVPTAILIVEPFQPLVIPERIPSTIEKHGCECERCLPEIFDNKLSRPLLTS